jgi:hypothetical protein
VQEWLSQAKGISSNMVKAIAAVALMTSRVRHEFLPGSVGKRHFGANAF